MSTVDHDHRTQVTGHRQGRIVRYIVVCSCAKFRKEAPTPGAARDLGTQHKAEAAESYRRQLVGIAS